MNTQDFLIFRLRQLQYGIPISCVREIFALPEINPVPEAPGDIIGLLDWRGTVLPVMHLDRRLGQPMQPCRLSDSVIVIEWQGLLVGMLVNQIKNVASFPESLMERDISYGRDNHINTAFLTGVAKGADQIILLLNPDALIRLADDVAMLVWESDLQAGDTLDGLHDHLLVEAFGSQTLTQSESGAADFYTLFCSETTVQERAIFAKRAAELKQSHDYGSQTATTPIAVLGLAGEYFGINLEAIKEFIDLPRITPIPCCPPHILGNLNLRGEIVTLVDLKSTFKLNTTHSQRPKTAVIAQVGKTVAGIAIDELCDILYISGEEISVTPDHGRHWIQGVTPYDNKMVSILNLYHLLESEILSVNEVV